MNKKRMAAIVGLCICFSMVIPTGVVHAQDKKTKITFADVGWDSIKLCNALAGVVAENVFGYEWEEVPGSTPIAHEALINGEVDICLEEWTNNISSYEKDREAGKFTELGINYNDNHQGFYIPRYVAEEYPDLRTVKDLKKYASLFADPEDPQKGLILGGIPGWEITEIMEKKVEAYGLGNSFNYVEAGSNAALDSAITSAYDKKQPIVTYYWEPTWLMGKYDFVLLEDEPYQPETFRDGIGACPPVTVTVAVSNSFAEEHPEFCSFLSKFHTSSALISEGLYHMQKTGDDHEAAALWLMQEHPELVDEWLEADQKEVLDAKIGEEAKGRSLKQYLFEFPLLLTPDTDAIDESVREFAADSETVLGVFQKGLGGLVQFFSTVLNHIPWMLVLLGVFYLGWHLRRKWFTGLIYSGLISLIGFVGLWDEMILTLSIVLASVVIALLLGLPIGILLSSSEHANEIARPILDTMQTMPVFVYLIPALLFFGMGNASAVMATVVYAVVPVIRLTSLGIRQVDEEVVEAARSFGSTWWQILYKVQIPQALPTIMTGINQTLMMAMAMVVTCSMIGARGLGMEVLNAVNRIEIGRGLIVGGCVVILAIVLDRLTQGMISADKQAGKETGKNE